MYTAHLKYNSKLVRDLTWAIGSPPLVCADFRFMSEQECNARLGQVQGQLMQLDRNDRQLAAHIEKYATHRLGSYFEALVGFYLSIASNITNLKQGRQVVENGHTVGELDFVFDEGSKQSHWEVAVKFYLETATKDGLVQWVGPGGKDMLHYKVKHLAGHQLKLAQHPAAAQFFNGVHNISSKALVKGMLFRHWKVALSNPLPEFVPDSAIVQRWCFDSEVNQTMCDGTWIPLNKRQWLGIQLLETLPENQKADRVPVCYARFARSTGQWMEQERMMVVPDGWP